MGQERIGGKWRVGVESGGYDTPYILGGSKVLCGSTYLPFPPYSPYPPLFKIKNKEVEGKEEGK
jgi:hypothetical protein